MLTRISSSAVISRFQGQSSFSSEILKNSRNDTGVSEADNEERNAQAKQTRRTEELHQSYQKKEKVLETNYNNESRRLEREYQQNKAMLEKELQQKKQALKVYIYV